MGDKLTDSVRFISLKLQDHGVFKGSNEIVFGRGVTVIAGAAGMGKTTIVRVLAGLGPEVTTEGGQELIQKYGRLIFLGSRSALLGREELFAGIIYDLWDREAMMETRAIFMKMLVPKLRNARAPRDLDPSKMAAGERCCLGYASAFAARKALGLDLPVVFDSPYGILDRESRQGVSAFLREQSCQRILLGLKDEFSGLEKPDYVLEMVEDGTRVRKV